jgi:NADH-quinone oxidoreductase subunit H
LGRWTVSLDFHSIYEFFATGLSLGVELPGWLAFALAGGVLGFLVINVLMVSGALYTWFERRALGRFQVRLGPNRWGPFGILQPIADGIKLLTKEDTIPDSADRPAFTIAPILLMVPMLLVVAVVPLGEDSFLGRLNIGVLFIIGVTSVSTIAIFVGGWASGNKYAMLGSMRGVAMLISYEVPMALAIAGVLLVVEPSLPADAEGLAEVSSMALSKIVAAQVVPFLLVTPLAFLVFVAAATAEMSRTPFDQIEAESELGSGYHTEYSGVKFAIFQLAEFLAPIVTAVIVATLFLGGTRGFDPVPGQVWFVLKVFVVIFLMLWVRATWPRLRIDQIMGFAWKGLLALSLVNLFLVAAEVEILRGDSGELTTGSLWIMAAINWAVTLAAIAGYSLTLRGRRSSLPEPVRSPLANMYAEAD